jgi:glycosyltransferase involved in cell wall biosynthesis
VTDRKLVSVVTGTYQRHDLLLEAIQNVRQQTYRPLEHVIVADGPDPALADLVEDASGCADLLALKMIRPHEYVTDPDAQAKIVRIRFAELGFWSSGLLTNSISAAPFMVAQLLARGDYQITMSDDERFLDPDAIAKLVDALETYEADFAYSQAEITFAWNNPPMTIGLSTPQSGQITQFLYRREMLDKGMLFRTHIGNATDWDAVSRTMKAHATWVFVPEVLVTHRADK